MLILKNKQDLFPQKRRDLLAKPDQKQLDKCIEELENIEVIVCDIRILDFVIPK